MKDWKNTVTGMKAHRDGVILKILREPSKTPAGLLIPETADRRSEQGKVVSVGPDVERLKPNDLVVFDKHLGIGLGDDYLVIPEADIIARISEEAAV